MQTYPLPIEVLPPSPLQQLHDPLLERRGVRVWLKRDDLRAPAPGDPYCGNKCRKLHPNLVAARAGGFRHLISCGGAYSNHIAALASAGRRYGFRTTGIIRGEPVRNPTLDRARAAGMQLHFVTRTVYRQRHEPMQQQAWQQEVGTGYWIPEGGTNDLALRGCAELYAELVAQLGHAPDYVLAACGTGGTLAGLLLGAEGRGQLHGISVLKGDFVQRDVAQLLAAAGADRLTNWTVHTDFHAGGYARLTDELYASMRYFWQQHRVLPDPIYTGKLFRAAYLLIDRAYFPPGSSVVLLHSGGLQGWGGVVSAWPR